MAIIETSTDSKMRSSAQGLFMMMSNGFGAFFGGLVSGKIIDTFFTTAGTRDWHNIWLSFAGYAFVIAIAFAVLFKHKHNPEVLEQIGH
jgi:MFS transporter, NHS family, xanthosine permease